MPLLVLLSLFIFGTFIGSFLNVLADRLPKGKNPWLGRSKCDHCKKTLEPNDLIPLLSFLMLGGRCRYCKKKLSYQYPFAELVTGIVFTGLYLYVPDVTKYLPLLVIFCSFLVIFIADMKYQVIPDEVVITSLVGTAAYLLVTQTPWTMHLLSGFGAFAFFLTIFLLTKGRGMGFGDVKLSLVLGLFLGFPAIVLSLYLAFLTGAALSLILILTKAKKWRSRIAFGPFLLCGFLITYLWGNEILVWYHRLLY